MHQFDLEVLIAFFIAQRGLDATTDVGVAYCGNRLNGNSWAGEGNVSFTPKYGDRMEYFPKVSMALGRLAKLGMATRQDSVWGTVGASKGQWSITKLGIDVVAPIIESQQIAMY